MTTTSKRKTRAEAAGALGLVIIAAVVLAGCGQVSASGNASGSGSGHARSSQPGASHRPAGSQGGSGAAPMIRLLCPAPGALTAVRVVRTPSLSQLGQTKPLPKRMAGITVSDPAKVRLLARAICALPRMPHGPISCPANLGGGFVLAFTAPGQRFHAVTVQATGCESVIGTGAGRSRWVARTPGFWATFAHLTGIRAPAHSP